MKKYAIIFLILIGCEIPKIEEMAKSVPDTNTYSLADVLAAVEDHEGTHVPDSLDGCFYWALPEYFDGNYHNESYAPADSLKRFRKYGPANNPDNGTYPITVPQGFSPNGDGVHDFFEIVNLEHYPNHRITIFDRYSNILYRRTNDYHLYPWDGKYNGSLVAAGTYSWVLEINGSQSKSGAVMVAY